MSTILYEERGHIGIITINRPNALNAFNNELITDMFTCLETLQNSALRCLIITGAGEKAFVAGADIAEMQNLSPTQATTFSRAGNSVMDVVDKFPVPVIAAVNGYALGGGCELALSCDIRVASEDASFALPETGLGIIPGFGGIQRLARAVGVAKAKELVYTTDRIKAGEALRIGLVNAVVPKSELIDYCLKMAERIAANGPFAVRAAKKVINQSVGMELAESIELEVLPFSSCFKTNDQKMAMTAFVEKKKPEPFTGS